MIKAKNIIPVTYNSKTHTMIYDNIVVCTYPVKPEIKKAILKALPPFASRRVNIVTIKMPATGKNRTYNVFIVGASH